MVFVPVSKGKSVENRLHIDLAPTPARTATARSSALKHSARDGWM
jgi:hypothetical protein